MNIFGTLCKEVPIDSCKCRLSFQTLKEMQIREGNAQTCLCPLLPAGQEGVCVTGYFVLPYHCSLDRVTGVHKIGSCKLLQLVLAGVWQQTFEEKKT